MSIEPIRLNFFPTVEDIPIGKSLQVTFKYSHAESLGSDKVVDLQGSIDLLLPQGSFLISNFYWMTSTEQAEVLKNYVYRMRTLDEELDDDEIQNRFRNWLIITSLIYPMENVHSRLFQSASDIFAILFYVNDLAEDEDNMSNLALPSDAMYRRYDNWEFLFDTGNSEGYIKIGQQFPFLNKALHHLALAVDKLVEFIPEIRDLLKFTNRAFFKTAETTLLTSTNMTHDLDTFSEETLKVIDGLNTGFQMPLELITALEGIVISHKIRDSLVFKIFMNSYNVGAGLFKDIFQLNSDLTERASRNNSIERQVIGHGMTYPKALKKTLAFLKNTTKDMKLAGRRLMETFPEEKFLVKFVQNAEYIFDGQIYSYLVQCKLNGRYKTIEFKIIEK